MAKRMMTITLIVLGISMFLMMVYFLVLFIAPGFKLFGLMYVTRGTRSYNSGTIRILDEMAKVDDGTFTGSIILEVDEAPVYVKFTQSSDYQITFYEDYSGLTKTDIDYPSMTFSKDRLGGAHIKVNGFKKWVFENSNTKRYVVLNIPLSNVGGVSNPLKTDLTIKSKNSNIHFSREASDLEDLRIPNFNNINITTDGKVEYETQIKAKTFNYETDNSIIIPADDALTINATNYNLKSNGRVVVKKPILGNLKAEAKRDISLISCSNLDIKTKSGDVKCYAEDKRISVSGIVNITTTSGNVTLGEVKGTGINKITTSSGKVDVQKIIKGNVTTQRGSVRIDSTTDVSIETNMGRVEVEEAINNINIKTKRGNIYLGGKGMLVNNPTVTSNLGKIVVLSASSKVNIEAIKGNVEFTNDDSQNITIKTGGKLTAKGLTGEVNIDVAKNADITFSTITSNKTVINAGDKCKELIISAINNSKDDTRYDVKGKNVTRYVDNANGTGTFSTMEQSEQLVNKLDGNGPYLKASGKNANISLYFMLSASESE